MPTTGRDYSEDDSAGEPPSQSFSYIALQTVGRLTPKVQGCVLWGSGWLAGS